MFSDPDLLQSCDKADLGNHISGGSVHWTAIQGLWQPAKNQVCSRFCKPIAPCRLGSVIYCLVKEDEWGVKGVKRAK